MRIQITADEVEANNSCRWNEARQDYDYQCLTCGIEAEHRTIEDCIKALRKELTQLHTLIMSKYPLHG